MSGQTNIGIVSRGDVVRAIRQSIVDSGIDLNALVQQAVESAVSKRVAEYNLAPLVTEALRKSAHADIWEIRKQVASDISRRITLAPAEKQA